MKKIKAVLLFCACSLVAIAQSSNVKVKNVFDYQVGDTLLYKYVNCPNCSQQNRITSYREVDIFGKTLSGNGDTLFYQTNYGLWTITNLDSLITKLPFQGDFLLGFDSFYANNPSHAYDTAYIGFATDQNCTSFNIIELNNPSQFGRAQDIKYADSLGLISQSQADEQYPLDQILNFEMHLVYYKKGNVSCGNYPLGIGNVANDGSKLFIYPQVVENILCVTGTQVSYRYSIFNSLGQCESDDKMFETNTTEINVNRLPSGMHYILIYHNNTTPIASFKFIKR